MPTVRSTRSRRPGAGVLASLFLLSASLTACADGAQESNTPEPDDALARAITSLEEAGRGAYAVTTMTEGQEGVRVDGTWQLNPARHRSTTSVEDASDESDAPVMSTVVEDAEQRWTLRPEFHDRDDCWVRGSASDMTSGVPGVLRLLLEADTAAWENADTTLTAFGPASAVLSALGELGDLLPPVPEEARVQFTVLLDDGEPTAVRTDLGDALEAVEAAGVALPAQMAPFTSDSVEITVMAGFSRLGEDVDTAPPPKKKVRDC